MNCVIDIPYCDGTCAACRLDKLRGELDKAQNERDMARAEAERWKKDCIGELARVLGMACDQRDEARSLARTILRWYDEWEHGSRPTWEDTYPWLLDCVNDTRSKFRSEEDKCSQQMQNLNSHCVKS